MLYCMHANIAIITVVDKILVQIVIDSICTALYLICVLMLSAWILPHSLLKFTAVLYKVDKMLTNHKSQITHQTLDCIQKLSDVGV